MLERAGMQYRIAGRLQLHSTATGKVFLAFGQSSLVEDVVVRADLMRHAAVLHSVSQKVSAQHVIN
ncbi:MULTISPECIES: IclR family transcriptional regulator C-terminal domain-containing protein [unclassified Mycolicibacterium]|uniref:IclR family transcriptional regulator C-terminal domain-containing protein n=1 Tax=unclassified Mycolicibacterium TaxID=2636767 RepID=UPI0012DD8A6F|nr:MULTISPECIES: IclR family transcriptional regulator C-terminal domain-containing protein [unclassified Mycolicibacterium]MUL81922.1 hypothetical protein [Mycolicibacterium sp. CBMA 329]MUL87688.1 hypothetical protein [Mycolicibacterium sp. CBMA 331]MUL99449.1 hypothetical protein [Mycolicibacterium sp. CBMA 334]MUM27388.1 hypothetical protein [Mycolicibacterium sp. CBMA 295]MUM37985.1 hypothetical protein [Mycolicibacterium sp. CBMA 247]